MKCKPTIYNQQLNLYDFLSPRAPYGAIAGRVKYPKHEGTGDIGVTSKLFELSRERIQIEVNSRLKMLYHASTHTLHSSNNLEFLIYKSYVSLTAGHTRVYYSIITRHTV